MKKIVYVCCLIFCFEIGFAQEEGINYIGFGQNISYNTMPLSYFFGMGLRKNDFSLFAPFFGGSFNANPNPVFTLGGGVSINYKKFSSKLYTDYELYALGVKPFSKDSEYTVSLHLGYVFDNCYVSFIQSLGNKRWLDFNEIKTPYFSVWESIQLSAYLLRNEFFYATAVANLNFYHIPSENFSAYELNISIPFQFNYFYGESCFLYNGFYTNYLDFQNESNHDFIIQKKYSAISKRIALKENNIRYKMIHLLELEQRFYIFRMFDIHNSFFISVFLNGGLCLTNTNAVKFEYETGFGMGYAFLGSVPFTFQLGINKDKSLIMYLGIVSKIINRP